MDIQLTKDDLDALKGNYLRGDVSRKEAQNFIQVHRGSVRLGLDLYRTEGEYEDFIQKGLRIKLPGQAGYSTRPQGGILSRAMKFFGRR